MGTPSEVHFGLGDARKVDIEVEWADGSLQSLGGVPVDQTIDSVAVPEPCTLVLQLVALATLLGVRARSATPWSPRLPSANPAEGPC